VRHYKVWQGLVGLGYVTHVGVAEWQTRQLEGLVSFGT
jgi:hypothetical protein